MMNVRFDELELMLVAMFEQKTFKGTIENIPFLRPHKTLPLFTLLVVITRRE